MTERVTILIPTRGRPEFLRRCLGYYFSRNTPLIFVGDSSDPTDTASVDSVCSKYSGSDRFRMEHYSPEIYPWEKLGEMLKQVTTPYTIFPGDDDFVVPEAIDEAADILDADSTCATVSGAGMSFSTEGNVTFGPLDRVYHYHSSNFCEPNAGRRLTSYLNAYTPLAYSLIHTNDFKEAMGHICANKWTDFYHCTFGEVFEGSFLTCRGINRSLDRVMYIRQAFSTSTNVHSDTWNPFQYVSDPAFADMISRAKDILAEEISHSDNIAKNLATNFVEVGLWSYFQRFLGGRLPDHLGACGVIPPVHPQPWTTRLARNMGVSGSLEKNIKVILRRRLLMGLGQLDKAAFNAVEKACLGEYVHTAVTCN